MKTAILIAVGAVILVVFSCSNEGDGFLARILKGGRGGIPVMVESVVLQERQKEIAVPAIIAAAESTEISLPDDVIVERVIAPEGSRVNAGDPIIRLSDTDISARLARLKSDAKDAQATLDKNSYFLKNRDRLLTEGRIDQTQYDNLESEVSKDEAALEKLKQDISRIEERALAPVVVSPFAGTVVKMSAAPGITAYAGKPIAAVAKGDGMTVSLHLPSLLTGSIQAGHIIRIKFPDLGVETVSTRINSVGTEIDETGQFTAYATLPSNGRFKAGMRAQALVPTGENQRIFIIPESALLRERGAVFVFTVDKGKAHKAQVIPSESVGDRVEILRGLKEDGIVVVSGQEKLSEGTVVDIWRK